MPAKKPAGHGWALKLAEELEELEAALQLVEAEAAAVLEVAAGTS